MAGNIDQDDQNEDLGNHYVSFVPLSGVLKIDTIVLYLPVDKKVDED